VFSKSYRLAVFIAWVLPLPQLLRWDAAYAELWVGAVRREVLDRMLIFAFTSTEVVYGVTGTGVTELPEYGVSP